MLDRDYGRSPDAGGPRLSIVIPTLEEASDIGLILGDLRPLQVEHEVIVVDGGSVDLTRALAAEAGATVVLSEPGRGTQLDAGARQARAPLLCFLHADVRLDPAALEELARIAGGAPAGAFAFRLKIDHPAAIYRVLEAGANFRSKWMRLPFGDQGLIVRRDDYEDAGGYPRQPLMEDVALVRALGRSIPVHLLTESVSVSARRWVNDGPVRRSAQNLLLLARFLLGASPERLAASYRASGRSQRRAE